MCRAVDQILATVIKTLVMELHWTLRTNDTRTFPLLFSLQRELIQCRRQCPDCAGTINNPNLGVDTS